MFGEMCWHGVGETLNLQVAAAGAWGMLGVTEVIAARLASVAYTSRMMLTNRSALQPILRQPKSVRSVKPVGLNVLVVLTTFNPFCQGPLPNCFTSLVL